MKYSGKMIAFKNTKFFLKEFFETIPIYIYIYHIIHI